jgi:hypothetical protein
MQLIDKNLRPASQTATSPGATADALTPVLGRFVDWLRSYGETSRDHQSYFAGPIGGAAKALYYRSRVLGTLAVAPMIFSEALFPAGRHLFWKKQRFPIADAHYAMGFAYLFGIGREEVHYRRAVHFLKVLEQTRCAGYTHHGWGYPFDWVTRTGVMKAGTPLITTTPYAYEAFEQVFELDADQRWLEVMRSIAEHAYRDIPDRTIDADTAAAGYNPLDRHGVVVNASAYRAFLLASAAVRFDREDYRAAAARNLNFVLQSQRVDGSWPYAMDGVRSFVDHFHTCFVLKALAKIERLGCDNRCRKAIDAGVAYYTANLFDDEGLPRPFSHAPRLTVYKRELYDYAECINLGALLLGCSPALDQRLHAAVHDLCTSWQKPDGSFRSRKLLLGWDDVPMHRWAQSQAFRSLAHLAAVLDAAAGKPLPAPSAMRMAQRDFTYPAH